VHPFKFLQCGQPLKFLQRDKRRISVCFAEFFWFYIYSHILFRYTTSEFSSVSQQHHKLIQQPYENTNKRYDYSNKPCWTREKRKRPKRNYTMFESTFNDTEASIALDIMTVTFNMNSRIPFGMSVVKKQTRSYSCVFVHAVASGLF
jgi:hypothetical protein